jgi:hypothetical protein
LTSKNKQETEMEQSKFSVAQFLSSKQFTGVDKDIISVVLDDKKTYSIDEVKKAIDSFKNKGVK